jgi:hypothetical protein
MISEQAKRSIEEIFVRAASSRLCPAGHEPIEVAKQDGERHLETLPPHALVLTISSITFRMLFVLHYADDAATRESYLGADSGRDLTEVLMEGVNLCCGYINQQLVAHFPDLGMSTPYALSSRCIGFIDELKPDYVSRHELRLTQAPSLHVTLCVCAQASVDFTASEAQEQEEGELELF